MFRSAKTFVKKITLLTDPEPSYVSLVSGGANKSPFRAIRSEAEDEAMTTLVSKKSEGLEFQSVVFKSESFPKADDCIAWLSDGGISADLYDLTEEAEGFIAVSKSEFVQETLTEIPFAGMTMIVGKMAEAVQESPEAVADVVAVAGVSVKSEAVAPDAPTSPVSSRKFDAYDAIYSDGTTVEEVITDSNRWSGIPIGYYELNAVLTTALDNALRDGADPAVVRQIVSDYSDRLVLLAEASRGIPYAERTALFDSYGNRVKSEAESSEVVPEAEKAGDVKVEEAVTENTEIPAEVPETVEAPAAPESVTAEQDSAEAADVQAVEQAAVAKTDEVAEIKTALESLTGSISELVAAMKSDRENAEKLSARLERVENAGQSRKSATPDESVQVKKTETIKVGGRGMSAFNGN